MFRDTGDLLVNIEDHLLSVMTVIDHLDLEAVSDDDLTGTWTVVFSVDGVRIKSLNFRIVGDEP